MVLDPSISVHVWCGDDIDGGRCIGIPFRPDRPLRPRRMRMPHPAPHDPPRVRVGLFLQPIHDPTESPTVTLEEDLQLIEHLDALGYDEAWIGEHHSTGWETIASPAVFLAAAAARTRSIRLGSGVVPLPLHHPLVTAGEYVLLDHLTRGRVMLGVGPGGGLPSDPEVFGLDPARQPTMFLERLDVLMRLFTETEPFDVDGDGFALRRAVLQVRPWTRPWPELGIVAGRNRQALRRIGRYGARWLVGVPPQAFEEAWREVEVGAHEAGRRADRSAATLPVTAHLADDRQRALDEVREGAARERFDFATAVNGAAPPDVPRDRWVEHLAAQPTVVIGTPADACAKLTALLEATGAGGVLLTAKPWAGREAAWRSYASFARHVAPCLQESAVGLRAAEAAAAELADARAAAPR
jgi:limonene 1,2-monooxygenase